MSACEIFFRSLAPFRACVVYHFSRKSLSRDLDPKPFESTPFEGGISFGKCRPEMPA
jgi:hypothetical protein